MDMSWCSVCENWIPNHEFQRHTNEHLNLNSEEDEDTESISVGLSCMSLSSGSGSGTSRNRRCGEEDELKDIIINLQTKAVFREIEGGFISLLVSCLERENSSTSSVLVCGYVDHFDSVEEGMGWDCGWRNIQMISSHLLKERPEAREAMFGGSGFVPDVGSLQRWLELAWQRGFDRHGSFHFEGKVYGSQKWIGATECTAMLRSFGLRAKVFDFDTSNGSKPLISWVWNYFWKGLPHECRNQNVLVTNKMPLYFQHEGHSRTIVGIQVKRQVNGPNQFNLLVLDPSYRTAVLERSLRDNRGWQNFLERRLDTSRHLQYQICYVDHGIARGEELEQLKTLHRVSLRS